ncbi:hypothetical protein JXE04_00480 [Patescibacteria group bacterium]|nr:hypothetical protein [Patescibacteria group bacterium]
MKKQEVKRVLFWHNQYPEHSHNNPNFGRNGSIHRLIKKISRKKIYWKFMGGFINENRTDFWEKAETTDVLFCLPSNMDYDDAKMNFDVAEQLLLEIIQKIKEKNPKIKIFFLEDAHHLEKEISAHGEFITDLHNDEAVIKYFKK